MDNRLMNLDKYILNNRLKIKVIPNSSKTELVEENDKLKLYLKAVPEKNKANSELIKFFKKNYKLSVTLLSGKTSREKVLLVG